MNLPHNKGTEYKASSRPILFLLGLEGHFYVAKALSKQFKRPIIGLLLRPELIKHQNSLGDATFSQIYSFPELFLQETESLNKLSLDAINSEIRHFEIAKNIHNNTQITYYDRHLPISNSFEDVRKWQLACVRIINRILSEHQPAFALDGSASYIQNLMRLTCRHHNIAYIMTKNARVVGRVEISDILGQSLGMAHIFDQLIDGKAEQYASQDIQDADKIFDSFTARPERPVYANRNSRLKINWTSAMSKVARELFSISFKAEHPFHKVERRYGFGTHPLTNIRRGFIRRLRATYLLKTRAFADQADFQQSYFYLPLHYAPEISDMVFGAEYDHHEAFVTHLAKHIPSGSLLYVKEHTSMLGIRPLSFYKKLNRLFNVVMVPPSTDTFDLINNARATITVTGTAGWEAILMSKPVIVLGKVFYNFLPCVLKTSLYEDGFAERVTCYLKQFQPDQNISRSAYRAYYLSTYEARKGDLGTDTPREAADSNASQFATGLYARLKSYSMAVEGDVSILLDSDANSTQE